MANRGVKNDINDFPKLDLFNFDSPEGRGSRYILTSPRSLKACKRLNIKPVELLSKSLSEFSEDNPLLGESGGGALSSVYQEWDKDRRRKLQASRKERERIIAHIEEGSSKKEKDKQSDSVKITVETKQCHSHPIQTGLADKEDRVLQALKLRYEREQESSLLASSLTMQWEEQKSRAEKNRAVRARTKSMERQFRRALAEARHEERVHQLEQEQLAQNQALQHHLEQRDSRVQQTYQIQRKHKEDLIRHASECRGQRSTRARQALAEIEEELEEWRREVSIHRHQSTTQATNAVKNLLAQRCERVSRERAKREACHRERMEQLAEEERQRRQSYTEEIELKSERSESILREKSISLDKSRQAAYASANKRQKIKEKYLRNSFDKMALEAELMASLERKHLRKTGHLS